MKHLITLILLTASLSGFGQEIKTLEYPPKRIDSRTGIAAEGDTSAGGYLFGYDRDTANHRTPKPDTLRAYILVTMCRKCTAVPRLGYVIIEQGKRPVYLDCRKKALRLPQVGWGYEVVNPNEKLR